MQNTIYFGDRKVVLEEVKKELDLSLREKYGYGLAEAIVFEIEKMQISVDDVRRMKDFCYKTSEHIKIVFLSSFYWSDEVQNAMLKILEETPPNTVIYLFGLSPKYFLPTVLSRVQKVTHLRQEKKINQYEKEAREVLCLEPNDRPDSKIVKKILGLKVVDVNYEKNIENEKKDRESQILFLWALLDVLLEHKADLDRSFLEKINTISQLADTEGGNPTLFIEWLILSAPKI